MTARDKALAARMASRVGTAPEPIRTTGRRRVNGEPSPNRPTEAQNRWASGLPHAPEDVAPVVVAPRKRTREEKVAGMALTVAYNPEEASNALARVQGDPSALIALASMALEQANSIEDIKDVRDRAEAIRGYIRDRGFGIEPLENEAATVVLRAERKAGAELARTRFARKSDLGSVARAIQVGEIREPELPNLADMGIGTTQSSDWQRLAQISDEELQSKLHEIRAKGERITQAKVYALAPRPVRQVAPTRDKTGEVVPQPTLYQYHEPGVALPGDIMQKHDEWTADWIAARGALARLMAHIERGWPAPADRIPSEWDAIAGEIMTAGRTLLYFQRRVESLRTPPVEDE